MASPHYSLNWFVLGSGGGPVTSASYEENYTIGQPVISVNRNSSDNYDVLYGYWAGIVGAVNYYVYMPFSQK